MAGSGGLVEWTEGAAVWFQPAGAAAPLPGELVELHRAARVLLVSALVNGQVSTNKVISYPILSAHWIALQGIHSSRPQDSIGQSLDYAPGSSRCLRPD